MEPLANPAPKPSSAALVLPLEAVGLADLADVGGKNASLGELIQQLSPEGVKVPGGFAVTAAAYREFLAEAGLQRQLHTVLDGLDGHDIGRLQAAGAVRAMQMDINPDWAAGYWFSQPKPGAASARPTAHKPLPFKKPLYRWFTATSRDFYRVHVRDSVQP